MFLIKICLFTKMTYRNL